MTYTHSRLKTVRNCVWKQTNYHIHTTQHINITPSLETKHNPQKSACYIHTDTHVVMQSIITHKYKPRQHVYVHTHTLPGRFFQPFIIYLNPSYIQRVDIRFSYPLNTLGYTNTKTHMCTDIPAWTYTFSAKRWFSIFLWPVTILGELRHLCSRLFSEPSLAM